MRRRCSKVSRVPTESLNGSHRSRERKREYRSEIMAIARVHITFSIQGFSPLYVAYSFFVVFVTRLHISPCTVLHLPISFLPFHLTSHLNFHLQPAHTHKRLMLLFFYSLLSTLPSILWLGCLVHFHSLIPFRVFQTPPFN